MGNTELQDETPAPRRPALLKRALPLVVLVAGLGAFFVLDLDVYFSLEALKQNRESLQMFVAENGFLAILAFAGLYAVVVAFSLPGGAIMTLAGGFLFGTIVGGMTVVVGATIGATGRG
jgi:uncharacterized membrane protein YdjX (TVP38/TMEM64 family)